MAIVKASTHISASPAKVRAIFLDFPNIANWEKTFVKEMTPLGADGKPTGVLTGYDLKPNDKLHCVFWGGESDMTVLENSERCFKWQGESLSLPPSVYLYSPRMEKALVNVGKRAVQIVIRNEADRSSIWHGFVAVRSFIWEEAEGGGCKLTQTEEAKGVMAGILRVDGWLGGNLEKKFAAFNEGLKKEAEKA